jgi:precorrin-6B methylase 1
MDVGFHGFSFGAVREWEPQKATIIPEISALSNYDSDCVAEFQSCADENLSAQIADCVRTS